MIKRSNFHVPIYDAWVHIVICDNLISTVNRCFKKHGLTNKLEKDDGNAAYYLTPCGVIDYFIFFTFDNLNNDFINHEKSHVVEQILIDRCIKPVDEVRAYLDGFISKKVYSFFKKKKIKIKNA